MVCGKTKNRLKQCDTNGPPCNSVCWELTSARWRTALSEKHNCVTALKQRGSRVFIPSWLAKKRTELCRLKESF